jgi:hypothetical protein
LTVVPVGSTGVDSHAPRGGVSPRKPHQFKVLSIDRASGRTLWERTAVEEVPHEGRYQENGT